jgi:hypothetical protein
MYNVLIKKKKKKKKKKHVSRASSLGAKIKKIVSEH